MKHPLAPFARQGCRAPYLADWLVPAVHVVPVTCKGDLAVARRGTVVHRAEAVAAMVSAGRIRYAARWVCGTGGSTDVTLLVTADAVCRRCLIGVPGNIVYRCYARDGRLLYIGSTHMYGLRMTGHASHSPWWSDVASITREIFPLLTEARAAEKLAIQSEKPEHNRQWVKR